MKSPAPNKRFLRAVREERVHVHVYDNSTRGLTWRSLPFGMWFFLEHEQEGFVEEIFRLEWSNGTPPELHQTPGILVRLTEKGINYLDKRAE